MNKTNYTVNKEKKTIVVDRSFDAPLSLVWQAWTDSAILDLWWAPLPWKTVTLCVLCVKVSSEFNA